MISKELLTKILLKKAKGYRYTEKTDEYVFSEGKKQLVKSKTVTKHVHPDAHAISALLTMEENFDVSKMTDEQLQVEKLRLIRLLKLMEEQNAAPMESEETT